MKRARLAKNHTLRVRISEYEAVKVSSYAYKHGKTVSQIIREYIRRLPAVKMSFDEFENYYEQTIGVKVDVIKFNISILKTSILTLEEWLEIVKYEPEMPLDDWAEIAGW